MELKIKPLDNRFSDNRDYLRSIEFPFKYLDTFKDYIENKKGKILIIVITNSLCHIYYYGKSFTGKNEILNLVDKKDIDKVFGGGAVIPDRITKEFLKTFGYTLLDYKNGKWIKI